MDKSENLKNLLFRYGSLKLTISEAEAELEMMKESAMDAFQQLRGEYDQITLNDLPKCSFSLMKRKTWNYSPMVKELETKFKDRKKWEEQTGEATFTEKESLVFNAPKEE